jgi:hypothetical protein
MRRAAVIALPFLLLLALGLAAWWYWQPADIATLPQSGQVENAAVPPPPAAPPAAPHVAQPGATAAAPPPATAAAARRELLQQRARAGDAVAAAELGSVLAACANYSPMPDENIEEAVVNGFAAGTEPPQINGRAMTPELLIGLFKLSQRDFAQRCADSEGMVAYEDIALALPLLQQAAEAGETRAMVDYAQFAFRGYDGADDMLRNTAEVKARRDRARAYLDRAVAAGDARALLIRADARVRSGLLPPDAVAGYADLYAFTRTAAAADWPPELAGHYLGALAHGLDAAQLAQARARGEAIWRACCAGARP